MPEALQTSSEQGERVPERRLEVPALFLLAVLSGVWAWWAWKEGAYFGTVALPGTIVLCAAAGLLLAVMPAPSVRITRPVGIAFGSLLGLGLWTLASTLWTPAPDTALADAQRVLAYALSFALGLALCSLLRRRTGLALVPLVIAAAVAGMATIVALGSDAPREVLFIDGTLEFPLGYHNANAAFFAIALFPALGLASDAERDWRLRALALGTATLAIEMVLLSQSRASVPAIAIALTVFVLASPERLRSLFWLALALLPAVAVIPPLAGLYGAVDDEGLRNVTDELRTVARVTALSSLAGVAVGALGATFERRLPGLGPHTAASNRAVLLGLLGCGAALVIGFVVAVGNPVDWVADRAEEFKSAQTPDLSEQSTRFTFNAGSERYDLWRVAIDAGIENPLLGEGAGGFEHRYLRERTSRDEDVRDAHSVELELFSELGLLGLLLLLVALGAAGLGVIASRRLGQPAARMSALALAGGTYWLLHGSIDWFWTYAGVTAPMWALLGSACAQAGVRPAGQGSRGLRWVGIAALATLAISTVPPFLSQRYVDDAYSVWRTGLGRSYDDLDRARALNPLSVLPLLAEGVIARASGDETRAIEALSEAADERPEEWAAPYLLAELHQDSDPAAARREITLALELNPLSSRIRELAQSLGVTPPPKPD